MPIGSETPPTLRRDVVSYVRRGSRMNHSQVQAWTRLRPRYVIRVPSGERVTSIASDARIDWSAEFGRTAPLLVEIGTGSGDALAALAVQNPHANVIGFEVFEPGVASTLSRLARDNVANVRLLVADGVQGLRALFAKNSITELRTFFPDPWHKKRHHKRRLISSDFAALAASRLLPDGHLRLATDWENYAEWMREILDAEPALRNVYDGWAPRPADRPVTRFEQRGIDAGRQIYDLCYRRVNRPASASARQSTPEATVATR